MTLIAKAGAPMGRMLPAERVAPVALRFAR
jgi:hypothetical protein